MEAKEPHSISLKVLRLARPSLAQQHPLPETSFLDARASLALSSESIDEAFALSPLLTFPASFGQAYVGEGFDCTLNVNNELLESADRKVASVKVSAEMQTPSQIIPLDLVSENDDAARHGLSHGESVQSILHFDLREEGSHTLCVNVSYNESIQSTQDTMPSGGRIRSFRKLYQFLVSPCLSVRTKASTLLGVDKNNPPRMSRYALECQLENLAEGIITIEELAFEPRQPFKSISINWDLHHIEPPSLKPREVTQVAFLIDQEPRGSNPETTQDGRIILGVLTIHWRSAMGHLGVLSTGWLTARRT